MYQYKTRVGYSQTDKNKNMTLGAIIDCFQDCSCFHSEEVGRGFAYLEPKHLVWILNFWQIQIKRRPAFAENITVGTLPYAFRGFIGSRNFWIEDESGEKIVMANSIWTHMNLEKQIPVKASDEIAEAYGQEDKIEMDYAPRKIPMPSGDGWKADKKESLIIKEYHLDSNNHVNNGQYVRIAFSYLPADLEYKGIRVEYKKQALLSDVMCPTVYEKENLIVVTLSNEENEPYAVIEVERF